MSFYEFARAVVKAYYKIFYRVKIEGLENIPKEDGYIVCANHKSLNDPPLLAVALPIKFRFMAKEELFVKHGKAVNRFLRTLGAFPVKRGSGDTKAIEQAIEILEQGGLLGIFPQGGIVAHGIPFQPKSGIAMIAYHAKAPVLPVGIDTNGDIKAWKPVTIRFGKPIAYEEFGFTDGSRKEMKYAAHIIAERVNQLLEAKE